MARPRVARTPCYPAPVLGLLVAGLVHAQPAPADAPAPDAPAPPLPDETPPAAPIFVPPALAAPLAARWPAELPAPLDAVPVAVDLELLVDEQGRVEDAKVVAGDEPFAGLALAEARAATFVPATEDGAPVAVVLPVHLEFVPPPVNVSGTVRLAGGGGRPAVGIPVRIGDRTTLTDAEGRFGFRGVPAGAHELRAGDDDVRVEPQPLEVAAGEALTLALWGRPRKVDEGIVGTYRRERDEVLRRSLTAEELRTTPGTLGDPLRAVANLPGTVRTPLDAGWLLVRGGDPRDTGVYIDGVRVPLVYHLGGFTSVVHPGFVDRVDFYPGGQSARYGRATAGAVDLVTRRRPEQTEVRAGLNLVLAGAYVAAPIARGVGFSAGVRRSYLDTVLDAVPGVSAEQAAIAPRFWDWQARVDLGPFEIFGLGYADALDTTNAEGDRSGVHVQTHRVHGAWRGQVAGKPVLVKPWVAFEQDALVLDVIGADTQQRTTSAGARVELADDDAGAVGWSAGLDAEAAWFGLRVQQAFDEEWSDGEDTIERYAPLLSPDLYGDLRLGKDARIVLGARLDTLVVGDQIPRIALSPRVSGRLPVTSRLTLVGDGGVYHQPPPDDLLVGPPEGSALDLERAWAVGAGARLDLGRVRVDLDSFGRRVDRMTIFEEDGSLGQGEGVAFGVESMVRYAEGRFSGWLSGSWSRSLRREEAGDDWLPSAYDQPVTVVAVGAYDLGRNWTLAGRWRYASGYPVAEPDTPAFDILLSTTETLHGERTDPFHALDLKVSKQALWKRWRLDMYLDLQNVYNRRVAEPIISGIWEVYGTHTYGFGLPILPIVGVEGVFGG